MFWSQKSLAVNAYLQWYRKTAPGRRGVCRCPFVSYILIKIKTFKIALFFFFNKLTLRALYRSQDQG